MTTFLSYVRMLVKKFMFWREWHPIWTYQRKVLSWTRFLVHSLAISLLYRCVAVALTIGKLVVFMNVACETFIRINSHHWTSIKKNNSVSIYQRNAQALATEIYKIRNGLFPILIQELFMSDNEHTYSLRHLRNLKRYQWI